jgi:hypothetical protein
MNVKKKIIKIFTCGSINFSYSSSKELKKAHFYSRDYKSFYSRHNNLKTYSQSFHYKKKFL